MPLTSFPINTVPPTGDLITNTPSGAVTATNVQAAINQLASLIPSPGPGTDPLTLTKGLLVDTNNPTFSGNTTDRWATKIRLNTDCTFTDPTFANNEALEIVVNATNGQATNNSRTSAKQSFYGITAGGNYWASGQKFLYNNTVTSFGMSDNSIWANNFVQYAGGPVNGDEGTGWGVFSNLQQQNFLVQTTITAIPTQSTVNTTTTQAITRSQNAQTVTVVSSAGVSVGDWVVIEQEPPNGAPNLEAVQVTAFGPTTITGVFRCSHNNGVTVTPALRMTVAATFQMGQDRVLINLSQPAVTAGTVSSISGAAFTGTGTAWANNMVGGNVNNIGAIALTADDYTNPNFFSGSTLKSWYQIISVSSATALAIHSFSTAADAGYHGAGPGAGGYTIRPAARILHLVGSGGALTGEIICETSTSTWAVGNTVECAICPYADVTGFQYSMQHFTRGGAGVRNFMLVRHASPRTFAAGITFDNDSTITQAGSDPVAYTQILNLSAKSTFAIQITNAQQGAIQMHSAFAFGGALDAGATFVWDSPTTGARLGPNSTEQGMDFFTSLGGVLNGKLSFSSPNVGTNPDPNLSRMMWPGFLSMQKLGVPTPYINIDNLSGNVNFEHGFARWESNVFAIGTDKGGTGNPRDLILKANNVEALRVISATNAIQISNAASFSANGAVATVLGSLGPTGSHTAVQTWLTFQDNTGTTRYIPCF